MAQLSTTLLALSSSFVISASAPASGLTLNSSSFHDHADIPRQYTCDGNDHSPALNWHSAPDKTQSFALILSDPDAPTGVFYHWVIFNLPASQHSLAEGAVLLAPALTGRNSWGKNQYNGPCPPAGTIHRYIFILYALDATLGAASVADGEEITQALRSHVLAKSTLLGVFGH